MFCSRCNAENIHIFFGKQIFINFLVNFHIFIYTMGCLPLLKHKKTRHEFASCTFSVRKAAEFEPTRRYNIPVTFLLRGFFFCSLTSYPPLHSSLPHFVLFFICFHGYSQLNFYKQTGLPLPKERNTAFSSKYTFKRIVSSSEY